MAGLLLPLALLGVMYAFLILPQRRKQRAHQQLLTSIGPGDEVMTSGGIYGGVTEVDGDDLFLEIAPDIEIKVAKRAIAERTFAAPVAAAAAPATALPDTTGTNDSAASAVDSDSADATDSTSKTDSKNKK